MELKNLYLLLLINFSSLCLIVLSSQNKIPPPNEASYPQIQSQQKFDLRFLIKITQRHGYAHDEISRIHLLGTFASQQRRHELTQYILYLGKLTTATYSIYNYDKFLERVDNWSNLDRYNSKPIYYCKNGLYVCGFAQIVFGETYGISQNWEHNTLNELYLSFARPHFLVYISPYSKVEISNGSSGSLYQFWIINKFPMGLYIVTTAASTNNVSHSQPTSISVACMHCSVNELFLEIPEQTTLKQMWHNVHKNANLGYLLSNMYVKERGSHYSKLCSRNIEININPNVCILSEIRHNLNFTLGPSKFDSYTARINRGWYPNKDIAYIHMARTLIPKLEHKLPYKFAVIVDRSQLSLNNLEGLYNTMDLLTWIFVLLSFISIILALVALTQLQRLQLSDLILQLYGTLLFQGISFPIRSPRVTLILSVWLLGLIVISNGYSSILSALIVRPKLDNDYPSNLQSVAKSKLLKYSDGVGGYVGVSIFELLNSSNTSDTVDIQNLRKIVSEIKDISVRFHEKVLDKRSFIYIKGNSNYAFDNLVNFIRTFSTKMIGVNKPLSDIFYEFSGHFVHDFYLKPSIDNLFSVLVESGIYSAWVHGYNEWHVRLRQGAREAWKLADSMPVSEHTKDIARKYAEIYDLNNEPEPLAFAAIGQIFNLYIGLIGISVIVFCLEFCVLIYVVNNVIIRAYH